MILFLLYSYYILGLPGFGVPSMMTLILRFAARVAVVVDSPGLEVVCLSLEFLGVKNFCWKPPGRAWAKRGSVEGHPELCMSAGASARS